MLLLGNELPNYRNNSGSVDRRIFMIDFTKKVRNSDPKLFDKFMKNIDLFQRKGVALYHEKLRTFGDLDIWASGVVGPQLHKFRQDMKTSTDMLWAFMTSGAFTYHIAEYMLFDDFVQNYTAYRKHLGAPSVKFTPDHYRAVFEEKQITVQRCTKDHNGQKRTATFLLGVCLAGDVVEGEE